MESNVTLLLRYFLNLDRACLFVIMKKLYFWQILKPFHTKSEMNKPQPKGKVIVCLYSRMQKKKFQHTSAIKKDISYIVQPYSLVGEHFE